MGVGREPKESCRKLGVAGVHALKILFRALDVGGCCVGVLFSDGVKILEDTV
jgi:hypothetical protein